MNVNAFHIVLKYFHIWVPYHTTKLVEFGAVSHLFPFIPAALTYFTLSRQSENVFLLLLDSSYQKQFSKHSQSSSDQGPTSQILN